MPKKHVREIRGRKEHENENNNEHEEFSDEEEKEEEQEHRKKSNEKKSSDSEVRNKKYACKENKSNEDEGNHESTQLIKKLKGDIEKAREMHGNVLKDSVHTEVRHEVLVDSLKEELCRAMHSCEDENCLEVEDTMKTQRKSFIWTLEKSFWKDERR